MEQLWHLGTQDSTVHLYLKNKGDKFEDNNVHMNTVEKAIYVKHGKSTQNSRHIIKYTPTIES